MDQTIKYSKLIRKLFVITGLIQLYFALALLVFNLEDLLGWTYFISAIVFFTLYFLIKKEMKTRITIFMGIIYTLMHLIWWTNLYSVIILDMISIITVIDKTIQIIIIILLTLNLKRKY